MSDTTNNPFEHILYEIKMYLYSQVDLIPDTIPNKRLILNMFVDSRAIHLRNLNDFFEDKHVNKSRYWHYSDYIDNGKVNTIKKDLFGRIKGATSQATCHLSNQRLKGTFKNETLDCIKDALPEMINAIKSFFLAMDENVKEEYRNKWNNRDIQDYVAEIKKLLPIFEQYSECQMGLVTTE